MSESTKTDALAARVAAEIKSQAGALAAKAPLNSPAFTGTPTGITAAHVGLGSVDNTPDASKPVSAAQQAALDAKVPAARTVAGKPLTSDVTLAPSDVGAVPATGYAAPGLILTTQAGGTLAAEEFDVFPDAPPTGTHHAFVVNGVLQWISTEDLQTLLGGGGPPAATAPTAITLSASTIAENATGAVGTLSADGSPASTFAITGGADAAKFSITGSTLSVVAAFDYETQTTASVEVTATNSAGSKAQTFSITVTNDTADDAPAASAYEAAVLADSPAAYFRCEEGSGSTLVDQMGGAGLTLSGTTTRTAGLVGSGAVSYAQGGQGHAIGVVPAGDGGGNYTLEAVVTITDATSSGFYVHWGAGNNGFGIGRGGDDLDTEGANILVTVENKNWGKTTAVLAPGTYHLAATITSGTTARLYVDGVLADTIAVGSIDTPGGEVTIGAVIKQSAYTYGTDSVVDEVAIYNTALSGARIAAHAAAV